MTPEDERRFAVFVTDRAEADVQNAAPRISRLLGPDYAARWQSDLEQTLAELAGFPGPRSHGRDEQASEFFGYEVRRRLYFGLRPEQGRPRRAGTAYRVRHGAQSLAGGGAEENGAP